MWDDECRGQKGKGGVNKNIFKVKPVCKDVEKESYHQLLSESRLSGQGAGLRIERSDISRLRPLACIIHFDQITDNCRIAPLICLNCLNFNCFAQVLGS